MSAITPAAAHTATQARWYPRIQFHIESEIAQSA
ncbi:MAG: hypothetical protein QOI24_3152 [Acidobacteriota bacterium]|nr:hypothetical protein [Acidobacteriota bacterium]